MKLSKILKRISKKDGKDALTVKTINKLKFSKEFNYLVDINRA